MLGLSSSRFAFRDSASAAFLDSNTEGVVVFSSGDDSKQSSAQRLSADSLNKDSQRELGMPDEINRSSSWSSRALTCFVVESKAIRSESFGRYSANSDKVGCSCFPEHACRSKSSTHWLLIQVLRLLSLFRISRRRGTRALAV